MVAVRPAARRSTASPLAVAAILAAAVGVPGEARAQCVTTTVGFKCIGLDPDGIAVGRSGIIGEVEPGARVEGRDAITLGERVTVIVEGDVEAGETGVAGGDRLTVLNEGRVAGGTAGVRAGDSLVLRSALGAAVEGGEVGVAAGEDPQIVNSGTIGDIRGEGFVTVRNDASGMIGGIGSNFGVTLDNAGSVTGGISAGFDTTILNRASGVLRGGVSSGPGINTIENHGLWDGDVYATQGLGVTNAGTFIGSVIAADEGPGVINSGLFRGAVVGVGNGAGGLVNIGEAISDGDLVVGRTGAFLTNSGSVVAGGSAVRATDNLASASVTNDGSITASDDGVIGGIASRIDDTGSIVAGSRGFDLGAEARIANGQLENRDAVIHGDLDGVRVGEDGRIENFGLIEGATSAAVRAGSGLDLLSEGPIRGGSDGVVVEGDVSAFMREGGSVEAPGVAIRGTGAVRVSLGIGGTVTGGEAGIVGGDRSSLGTSEFRSEVSPQGDTVRFGRGASIFGDGGIFSTGSGDAVSVIDGTVAAVDPEGFISAARGAAVRARGPEPGTGPAGAITVRADEGNTAARTVVARAGTVAGASGTAVDLGAGDDAVIGRVRGLFEGDVLLGTGDDAVAPEATGGRIEGRLRLGPGDDELTLASGTAITGDTLFGTGDDVLRYERSMLKTVADSFDLFDGRAGFDEAVFAGFGLGDLAATPVPGGFELLFEDGPSRLAATLTGFERVRLDDVVLSFPAAPAPAPLPAALPLLAAALGGLAALHRRARGPDPLPTA